MKAQVNFDELGGGGSEINPVLIDEFNTKSYTKTYNLTSGKTYMIFDVYLNSSYVKRVSYVKDNVVTDLIYTGGATITCVNNVLTITNSGSMNDVVVIVQLD